MSQRIGNQEPTGSFILPYTQTEGDLAVELYKYNPLKMVGRSTEVLFVSEDKKRVDNFLTRNGLQLSTPLRISNSPIKIAQNQKSVNTSVDFDSEGRELSEQQIEYFKNSKVRDDDGSLIPNITR